MSSLKRPGVKKGGVSKHGKREMKGLDEEKEECEGCYRCRLPLGPCFPPQVLLPHGSCRLAPGW